MPWMAFDSEPFMMLSEVPTATLIVVETELVCAVGEVRSVAVKVTGKVPEEVATPVICPDDESTLNPSGSVPDDKAHVTGAVPPADESWPK